jgi:hypothetical protein
MPVLGRSCALLQRNLHLDSYSVLVYVEKRKKLGAADGLGDLVEGFRVFN